MLFGFSAKNWLKIRYYMLDLEKSAGQCNYCRGNFKISQIKKTILKYDYSSYQISRFRLRTVVKF